MSVTIASGQVDEAQQASVANSVNVLFPVFLKLEQMHAVLIGGGPVALEKLQSMLANSPQLRVTVTALDIHPEIEALAANRSNIVLRNKAYEKADVQDAQVVFVAVNNLVLSQQIVDDAHALGLFVNVADTPGQCDFYLGSVVRKGNLKIAISTNGKSPTVAKRLREMLDDAVPHQIDELLGNMQIIRNRIGGDFARKVSTLNKITRAIAVSSDYEKQDKWQKIARWSLIIFASMLLGHFIFSYIPFGDIADGSRRLVGGLDANFKWIILAGFLAQLIDGSLGMGYGITSATILISAGVSPAAISGSIHTAEMFASGASGYSHYKFGNVNRKLFRAIVIPGVIGSIAGAVLLVYLGDRHIGWVRPLMASYTLFLGVKFIVNAFKQNLPAKKFKHYRSLAGLGGFLDSFGGGGWGPIVTSTLINKGRSPRYVIGTVSLTEFFVTLSSAFAFFLMIGVSHWQVIVALVMGSLLGAPLGAKLAGKMPRKTAFLLLGCLVIIWSFRILLRMLEG